MTRDEDQRVWLSEAYRARLAVLRNMRSNIPSDHSAPRSHEPPRNSGEADAVDGLTALAEEVEAIERP